jgi:hypothetical protein
MRSSWSCQPSFGRPWPWSAPLYLLALRRGRQYWCLFLHHLVGKMQLYTEYFILDRRVSGIGFFQGAYMPCGPSKISECGGQVCGPSKISECGGQVCGPSKISECGGPWPPQGAALMNSATLTKAVQSVRGLAFWSAMVPIMCHRWFFDTSRGKSGDKAHLESFVKAGLHSARIYVRIHVQQFALAPSVSKRVGSFYST